MSWSELNFIVLISALVVGLSLAAFIYVQVLRAIDILRDIQETFGRYLDWQIGRSRGRGREWEAKSLEEKIESKIRRGGHGVP